MKFFKQQNKTYLFPRDVPLEARITLNFKKYFPIFRALSHQLPINYNDIVILLVEKFY